MRERLEAVRTVLQSIVGEGDGGGMRRLTRAEDSRPRRLARLMQCTLRRNRR